MNSSRPSELRPVTDGPQRCTRACIVYVGFRKVKVVEGVGAAIDGVRASAVVVARCSGIVVLSHGIHATRGLQATSASADARAIVEGGVRIVVGCARLAEAAGDTARAVVKCEEALVV